VKPVRGDVEQPPVPLVLGLEEPSRIIERLTPGYQKDGLDLGEGLRRSWALMRIVTRSVTRSGVWEACVGFCISYSDNVSGWKACGSGPGPSAAVLGVPRASRPTPGTHVLQEYSEKLENGALTTGAAFSL
jgi:hypothetical protein